MAESQITVDITQLRKTILSWLKSRLEPEAMAWLEQKSMDLGKAEDWEFFTSFSAVPRYTGKKELELTGEEKQNADEMRPGWKPEFWSVDQLGRCLLVLSIANRKRDAFLEALEKTFVSSDMGEAEALYKSLAVLPYPDHLQKRAAEGIRSNMTSVFNAVALRNPYPADYFDEGAWNQLVLKALFVESPLYKIQGIERRRNQKLAEMLVDYAHERWAADRSVSPELWRPVGPFAKGEILNDLQRILEHPDRIQQQAAILALAASPAERAHKMVEEQSNIKAQIEEKHITWDDIGRSVDSEN